MLTLPPQISDAERAVAAYKHELLVRVMAHIVRRSLCQTYVFAGDVPEDIVAEQHRQGVASNAWNALRALEIIEALPLTANDPERGIFAGRKQNPNGGAKGRWVAVYRLASRARARAWANANGIRLAEAELPATAAQQTAFNLELNAR
jgi:hypothetical protein